MDKKQVRFINKDNSAFFVVLRQKVDNYFKENNISKNANTAMIVKTICMFAIYLSPYFLILTGLFAGWQMLLLCVVMGIGMAGIGMSVQHDANHAAYSANSKWNNFLGNSIYFIGGNKFNWNIQHNILHHTYTNIHDMDEDIEERFGLRLSPHSPTSKITRYQHIYAFFLYGFMTILWAITKDFKQFFMYQRKGINTFSKKRNKKELGNLILSKVIYYSYVMVLPLVLLDISFWQWLLGYFIMHYTAGIILSVIFQLAHEVEGTSHPLPDGKGNVETDWAIHQLQTTANFARKNKLISWYIGGLNYQVEHHLFPRICHVHYPAISKIVKETAEEFHIPYLEHETFLGAVLSHIRILKKLGREEQVTVAAA